MNKRMIVLIALVVAVSAVPASAETLEVRGTIAEFDWLNGTIADSTGAPLYVADAYNGQPGFQWDYSTFPGFWYDPDDGLGTETLTILAKEPYCPGCDTLRYPDDREIGEGGLIYQTHPVFQEYELHVDKGLTIGSDTGYYLEGWMGEAYVAIDNNADELCKLLVEFEGDDKKTLATGEEWDLGGGFALEVTGIDGTGETATIQLSKNGGLLDTGYLDTSGSEQERVYTYTADIGGEDDIPVFSCYVNAVSGETGTVELMYVFLIDTDVLEIETAQTYGAMEVLTASSTQVVLNNDETTIDLDPDTTEHIMGNMYFKTADDDNAIRFYPMVEYTEPGTYEVRGAIEELDAGNTTLGYDLTWDYSNFAGFWYDLDDNLCTEMMTILANERDATHDDTLQYPDERTIGEGSLVYTTHPEFQEYEMHQDIAPTATERDTQTTMEAKYNDRLEQPIGLCVDSDNLGGDCGYFIEGWMGEKYVAINAKADKLCKLLVEFEDDDTETLYLGKKWNLSDGFALELVGIDDAGNKARLQLHKDGIPVEESLKYIDTSTGIKQDRVYTYTANIGGETKVPVFSCYVDVVFKGDISCVQLMYAFLIDDEVLEIETSELYGAMEVMTASKSVVVLKNDENTIDLDPDTTEHIMGNIYFRTADDDTAIRFYPFVERTIGGEEPTPPPETIPAKDTDHDGVPDVWDADNSTTLGYWVNSDGIGRRWGDMNGDGKLTSVDALMILQAAAEKINL